MDLRNVKRKWWAGIWFNNDYIWILSYSGFRGGTHADTESYFAQHSADADNATIGASFQEALRRSRFVLPEKQAGFLYPEGLEFDAELSHFLKGEERGEKLNKELMQRNGYKTRKKLLQFMKIIHTVDDGIEIRLTPTVHDKLDSWRLISKEDPQYVFVPSISTPAEIGAALRLAFSRCS
jgi:CDI immunity protein